jgi:tRNA(Phe) wybutosine-synthesizing methylase Tyw3
MRGEWTGLILGILFLLNRANLMTTSSCFSGISQVVNNGSYAQMNMLTYTIMGWVFKWWCTVYKTYKCYLKERDKIMK